MAKKARRKGKGVGCLVLKGKTWYARWVVAGKIHTRTTKTGNRDKAEEKLAEFTAPFRLGSEIQTLRAIEAKIEGCKAQIEAYDDKQPAMTLQNAWDAFKVKPKGKTARGRTIKPGDRTLRDYEGRWNAFSEWMEKNHPQRDGEKRKIPWELRRITRRHAEKYLAEVDASRSGNTYNKTLTFLRLVFKVLAEDARVKTNPFDGINAAQHAIAKKRPLNKDELAKVAAVLEGKGELELLFALGYYTGARRGDCVLMKWGSNIDMGARKIRYTPHKTAKGNKQITLTMAPRLYDLLEATPENGRKGYVLPELAEIYQRDSTILSRRIQQVFKDAGIETTEEVKGYGNKVARVGFHSLRHANITAMIEAGIPLDVVQRQAGHSTIGMTAHYHMISNEALQAASDAIPDMVSVNALPGRSGEKAELFAKIEGMSSSEVATLLKLTRDMVGNPGKKIAAASVGRPKTKVRV